eukprot:scaffold87448_cov37-Tisochrysis_lutea.AAC.3
MGASSSVELRALLNRTATASKSHAGSTRLVRGQSCETSRPPKRPSGLSEGAAGQGRGEKPNMLPTAQSEARERRGREEQGSRS